MEEPRINIGVLTSSRADYGIYLPLLKAIKSDSFFNLKIIIFGTHLKDSYGYTLNQVLNDGFEANYTVDNLLNGDNPVDISLSYANTVKLFGKFWGENDHEFDTVLCLGDRFEMAAAVNAGIPFNINFGHLHAGETSEGAIDNIYRDQITMASKYHFVALNKFVSRVAQIVKRKDLITVTGAIGLENLKSIQLLDHSDFLKEWGIDMGITTILLTIHPETVEFEMNQTHCEEICLTIQDLSEEYQILITLPNADTNGSIYRTSFEKLASRNRNIFTKDNLGTQSYFSALQMCKIVVGNSSSGILEAATFGKYVINIGDRQKNRICSDNVFHVNFDRVEIIKKVKENICKKYDGKNIYENNNGVSAIIKTLKNIELYNR